VDAAPLITAGAVAAAVTSIGVLAGGGWRGVRRLGRIANSVEAVPELAAWVAVMSSDVSALKAEMHPNGGRSLKDQVTRIDERTETTAHRLAEHIGRCSHG
jgi:outer membrane murein-binding lipoprotein Lpp